MKSVKRKHVTLTLNQKLEIIKMLERGINQNTILSEFNIASLTIYDRKTEGSVAKSEVPTKCTNILRKDLRWRSWWFSAKRSECKPITGPVLIEKAKQLHSELNISESCVFSEGWLHNHGIRKLDISGKQKSADHIATEEYSAIFEQLVEEHGLSPSQIHNADETGLLWCCLPNSTLVGGAEKAAHSFKINKDCITVLVCANASSTHKLQLFVVGKYKKPRAFKTLTSLPVIYQAQGNAWMTAETFKDWFFNYFVPTVKKEGGQPEDSKAVLLLDNCRANLPASELVSGNIFTTYLPANVTSLIQPTDKGVIQNFKCFYSGSFVRKLVNSDCSVFEFQPDFILKDAVYAAALAWKDVKKVTVRKCWGKLWSSIRSKHSNDIQEKTENVPEKNAVAKLTENEIEQWLAMDKDEPVVEILSDAAITESVMNPQKPQEEEEQRYKEMKLLPQIHTCYSTA
uniref:HTH CENPB-type domain-containing protein n=1 Tax=Pelodiscus sinensis TaxID=13735 RepID=K7F7H6_PELSI